MLLPPAGRVELLVGPLAEGEVLSIDALRYLRTTFKVRGQESFGKRTVGPAMPSVASIPMGHFEVVR